MWHSEEYQKDIVRLYIKRAPGVSRLRFSAIHGLSSATVRDWELKYNTGQSEEEKGNEKKSVS